MPRPRRPGAPEPKRRSRKGCWPCKARKVKCGEEKPACINCQRQGEQCDYSVRLNWGGRAKRPSIDSPGSQSNGFAGTLISFTAPPSTGASTDSTSLPSSTLPTDGFLPLSSDSAVSPSTPAPMNIFDSPKHPGGSDELNSPALIDASFATNWSDRSPLTPPVGSGSLGHYPFGPNLHSTFSAAADQGVGLRSLSAFAFHSSAVSQPVSFLRNSVDTSSASDQNEEASGQMQDGNGLGFSIADLMPQDENSPDFGTNVPTSALMLGPRESKQRKYLASLLGPERSTSLGRPDAANFESKKDDQATRESSWAQSKWQAYLTSVTDNYGLDSGRPDRDLALNNDHAAIDINSALDHINRIQGQDGPASPGNSQEKASQGYYASPVPINIPRYLSPLPSTLLDNPINLMYFHHFVNHTSRMLVPHDCDRNPFISVLPAMAIGDPNLLNLLLAYSASHRARYLGHPEPANRIAHWVSDVFPTLRFALESSHEEIIDSHLATAILLLSLKIVSPGTFEVPITWQSHLKLARDLFLARSERISRLGNQIGAFFARWLGYIDTVGALSCRQAGRPLMMYHSVLAACIGSDNYDEFRVDCFSGFTPRTGLLLIRLARLVQECDHERFDELGNFRHDWHLSAERIMEAEAILGELEGLSERAHIDSKHHLGVEGEDMLATEKAFRSAGLIYLHRRVLGTPSDSYPVKVALGQLSDALSNMRLCASLCCLLPLFTLAVEASPDQRDALLERFSELEKCGMKQIQDARQLVQRCWEGDALWISLATGQFFG